MKIYKLNEFLNIAKTELVLYHGTKSKFDRFDAKYINTGFGMQEYGYGFYLSDEYKTAEQYSRGGIVMEVSVPDGPWLTYDNISMNEKMEIADRFFKYYTEENEFGKEAYETDETRHMFWEHECRYILDCDDGGRVYGTIASILGDDKETSEFLRHLGYIGIKYNERVGNSGKEFHNYLIFNGNDIKILKK